MTIFLPISFPTTRQLDQGIPIMNANGMKMYEQRNYNKDTLKIYVNNVTISDVRDFVAKEYYSNQIETEELHCLIGVCVSCVYLSCYGRKILRSYEPFYFF